MNRLGHKRSIKITDHFTPSERLRSLIILTVLQPMSSAVYFALFAQSYTSPKQGDD